MNDTLSESQRERASLLDWGLHKTFHVGRGDFFLERAHTHQTDPPTVGELFEFILRQLQKRVGEAGPPVDRVRLKLREALGEMQGVPPDEVVLDASLEEIFPLKDRARRWRELQRKLTGLYLPALEFPAGDVYFGTIFWITVKLGLLIFGLAACCVAAPVAAVLAWLVMLVLEFRYAVKFPERAATADDLAVYLAELRYGEFAAHIDEVDPVEVWDAYQRALAEATQREPETILPSMKLQEIA